MATPVVIFFGICLGGGGFDLFGRHVAGIFTWLFIAVLLLTGYGRGIGYTRTFFGFSVMLLAFASLSALSTIWSHSAAQSLIEFERAIAYLGFFVAAYLVCSTPHQRQRFLEGLGIALALLLLVALGDRLFPGGYVGPAPASPRMSYPVGYWNANGLFFSIAILTFACLSRNTAWTFLRWASVALIPVAVAGIYLTYSRGALLAGLVGLVSIFFLSRDRLWITTVVGAGLLASVPGLLAIRSHSAIADALNTAEAPAEGRVVLAVLVACMALSVLLVFAAMKLADARPGMTGTLIKFSRDRRFLRGVAATATAALAAMSIVFGGHVWDQFSGNKDFFSDDPEQHFTQLSGAGRYEFNQIAIDSFIDNPVVGTGAGTYRFEWSQNRPIDLVAQDAHSLYLEAFSELGIPGGILILALAGTILWVAINAWRRCRFRPGGHAPLFLSLSITILVAFGVDWFWELGASAALLMLVVGWLAALGHSLAREETKGRRERRGFRIPLVVCAWIAIILLAVPAISDRYMNASIDATSDGRLSEAVEDARTASRLNPWSPRPHMQLGVIAQSLGLQDRALSEFTKAIDLEPENWQTWYLRMMAELEYGHVKEAQSDLKEARSRNPRAPQLQPETVPVPSQAD